MSKKFDWHELAWYGDVLYKYKSQKIGEGIRVTIMEYDGGEGKEPGIIKVGKTYADKISMMDDLQERADKHYVKNFGPLKKTPKGITFGEFLACYFDETAKIEGWKIKPGSTKDKYRAALENQIAPKFGDISMEDITAALCEDVLDQCEQEAARNKDEKYGSNRRNWLQNIMSIIFKHAKIRGIIKKSPIDKIAPVERRKVILLRMLEKRMHPRSIDLYRMQKIWWAIRENAITDGRYFIPAIMMLMGLRNSEAAGLRFCDIKKISNSTFYSANVFNQVDKNSDLSLGLKTTASYRKIPILPELWELIEARKECIKVNHPGMTYEDIDLLTIACKKDRVDSPCNKNDIEEIVAELLKKAEVSLDDLIVPIDECMEAEGIDKEEETPEAYTFRRNFSSMLFDLAGLEDNEAMYLMGHSRENSSDRRNIHYSDAKRQRVLYNKLTKLSWAHGRQYSKSMSLSESNNMLECSNETEVIVDVYLEKGEGCFITAKSREPHDNVSIMVTGTEKVKNERTNIQEYDRKYDSSGVNLTTYLKEWHYWKNEEENKKPDEELQLLMEANANGWLVDDTEVYDQDEEIKDKYLIVLTDRGNILRLREDSIPDQMPNTRGKKAINVPELGKPINMLLAEKDEFIAAISTEGIRYKVPVASIRCPADIMELWHGNEQEFGFSPCNGENESISHICIMPDGKQKDMMFMLATNQGGIAKIARRAMLSERTEKKIVKLRQGEIVSGSLWYSDEDKILIVSSDGHVSAQSIGQIPERANIAGTVRGILCLDGARCIGLAYDEGLLATISSDGFCKATETYLYHPNDDIAQVFNRGVLGKQANVLSDGNELIAGLTVNEASYLYLASSDGLILKIDGRGVPVSGRVTKGNKLMKLSKESRVCCAVWGEYEEVLGDDFF